MSEDMCALDLLSVHDRQDVRRHRFDRQRRRPRAAPADAAVIEGNYLVPLCEYLRLRALAGADHPDALDADHSRTSASRPVNELHTACVQGFL